MSTDQRQEESPVVVRKVGRPSLNREVGRFTGIVLCFMFPFAILAILVAVNLTLLLFMQPGRWLYLLDAFLTPLAGGLIFFLARRENEALVQNHPHLYQNSAEQFRFGGD